MMKARVLVALMLLSLFYPLVPNSTNLEENFSSQNTIQAPLPTNEWGESLAGSDITHMSEDWNVLETRDLTTLGGLSTRISSNAYDYSGIDLVIDHFDAIHACAHNGSAGSLEYIYINQTGAVQWTTVDDGNGNDVGLECDIELDAQNRARIAYMDSDTSSLKFAFDAPPHYVNFEDWHVRTVTEGWNVSGPLELSILGNGTDVVLWIDEDTGYLMTSYYASTFWRHESVIESVIEGYNARVHDGDIVRILHETGGIIRSMDWPNMTSTNIDAAPWIGAPLDQEVPGDGEAQLTYSAENDTVVQFVRSLEGRREGRIATLPSLVIDAEESSAKVGDFNCDGKSDYILFMNQSLVVHHGRTSGFNPTPDAVLQQTSNTGSSISFDTGDMNRDGCDDVIFGMPYLNSSNGGARLHLGSSSGLDPLAFWAFDSATAGAAFGSKVAFIGDTHNDGYDDWAVLASDEGAGQGSSVIGRIHLFDGGSQAPTSSSLTLAGTGTNLQYGWAIEALGDIEGDGYDDFAISSAGGLLDLTGYGKVEIHSGSSTGHSTTPSATWMQSALQGTLLGYSVESLGDVNGDGYNDLGFGEPYVDTAGPGSNGAIHIAFGGANGFPSTFSQSIQGPSPGSKMGFQMSAAGDVDRDGYDDVWAVRPGSGATGDLALYWGSSSGLSSNPRVFSYSDVIDVVRSDDFDDDSQEEWLVIDEMKISVYEHLDWEQVSIEGPFAGESNFSELDLYIDGPGRSIIGVQTDSGLVILSRPDELTTTTSDWKQTKIGTGEAAYGVTEAGQILAISICVGGAICLHKETGVVVSTHTIESTGVVGAHPTITPRSNTGGLNMSYMLGDSLLRFAEETTTGFEVRSGPDLGQLNGTPIVLHGNVTIWKDDRTLKAAFENGTEWETYVIGNESEAVGLGFSAQVLEWDSNGPSQLIAGFIGNDSKLNIVKYDFDNSSVLNRSQLDIEGLDSGSQITLSPTYNNPNYQSIIIVNSTGHGSYRELMLENETDLSSWYNDSIEGFNWTDSSGFLPPIHSQLVESFLVVSFILPGNVSLYDGSSVGDYEFVLCDVFVSFQTTSCLNIVGLENQIDPRTFTFLPTHGVFGILVDGRVQTPFGVISDVQLDPSAGFDVTWAEHHGRSGYIMVGRSAGTNDALAIHLDFDSDRDFIPDILDELPNQGGQWSDYDGDGFGDNSVSSSFDDCPSDAGPSLFVEIGCGDFDNDGWSDYSDECATAGHSYIDRKGCSDADGDGWSNNGGDYASGDLSPTNWMQARDQDGDGLLDNHGPDCCGMDGADEFPFNPRQWVDADNDGVGDNNSDPDGDQCPGLFGLSQYDRAGCVDSDGDGYSDPTEATSTANDDAWTISDGADMWPWAPSDTSAENTCGSVCHQQWADSDGDGFGDNSSIGAFLRDAFPTDGWQWNDTDNDGFGDNWDDPELNSTRAGGIGQWVPQANLSDDCPSVSGNSTIDRVGCLDVDGDGHSSLYSYEIDENTGLRTSESGDALPENPFQWRDKDGDGFGDFPMELGGDQCPGDAGVLNGVGGAGCPAPMDDEDADLVADEDDDCPGTISGEVVDSNGCSYDQRDDDEDGVLNPFDLCANTTIGAVVDVNGCSEEQRNADEDDDGVRDLDDLCSDTNSGSSVDTNGCADYQRDTDEDGVTDNQDACPNTTLGAAVDDEGCVLAGVDSDNDGIDDKDDAFPTEPTQWLDTDDDGFGDNLEGVNSDECPSVFGTSTEDRDGCPDSDGDGWSDPDSMNPVPPIGTADSYPSEPTQWRDRDGDGFGDESDGINADLCPDVPGVENGNDGYQGQDELPWMGCPYIDKTDTDGDGVYDSSDQCSDSPAGVFVDSNGCTSDQLESTSVEETVDYATYAIMGGGILGVLLLIVITLRFISGRGDYYDDEDDDDWFDDDEDEDDDDFSPISKSPLAAAPSVSQTPSRPPTQSRAGPPARKSGPPSRAGPPARKSTPPARTASVSKSPKAVRRTSAPDVESVPRVSTKRVDPRKTTQPAKRVRRTAGVVTTEEKTERVTRQVKTTKKATKKVKKTASTTSESSGWNDLFEQDQKEAYSASLDSAKSMISSGSEDREILRRLQRGDGWSAEQSRFILDVARN